MKPRNLALAALVALAGSAALASAADDMTSLSYISYLERYATLRPAQGGETLEAVVNMPVLVGDRLDTARGARVEVELSDGSTLWVDEFTTVDFDAVANSRDEQDTRTILYLNDEGSIAVELPETALGDGPLRLDTPSGTLYLNRPGLYRVELRSGQLHVEAHEGLAELPSGIGSALVRGGQEAWLSPDGDLQRNVLAASHDDFWAWVQERRHPSAGGVTARYITGPDATRAYALDSYGDWVYVPTFSSYMWRPRVAAGWVPYSCGRWVWTPVGWTWVSYEPWGWYPFHYGSWYWDVSFGWVWSYDAVWGPAWVHWIYTPGYVGWCPRGYYDYWYWHQHHGSGDWAGFHRPGRWSDVALDFSGRVRLGEIDRRPWTVVPADEFGNPRLERVRLDPSRVFGDGNADRYASVRSGTLLTPPPGRDAANVIDPVLNRPGGRDAVDLGPILRREAGSGGAIRNLPLRPTLTSDQVRGGRAISRPTLGVPGELDNRILERRVNRTTTETQTSRERVQPRDGWVSRPVANAPGEGVRRRDVTETRPPAANAPERTTPRNPESPPARETSTRVSPGSTRQTSPGTRVERPSSQPSRPSNPRPGTNSRPQPPPRDGAQLDRVSTSRERSQGWEPRSRAATQTWARPIQPPVRAAQPTYSVRMRETPASPRVSAAPLTVGERFSPTARGKSASATRARSAPHRR